MRIRIGYAYLDRLLSYPDVRYLSGCCLPIRMLLTYPDVRYLSVCVMVSVGTRLPFTLMEPHLDLLLSGVTPLRWVLHHFGGGGMLPYWCNAP